MDLLKKKSKTARGATADPPPPNRAHAKGNW